MDFKMETSIRDDPEDIIISGISGRFPESENIKVLQENLFNKVDLGTDDERRWIHQYPDLPLRSGKIGDLNKFDAEYFNIPDNEADEINVSCRILLENTYEAIIDAGINPHTLHGTKTGVFIGVCFTEAEYDLCYDKVEINSMGVLGFSKTLLANRISYWLGVTGPSNIVDSACSSSFVAIDCAYRSIRSGHCDAAIVAAPTICFSPQISLHLSRLGVLSKDGRCKTFSEDGNGYMRSETIAVIYLQKRKDAKRVYATVVYTKTNSDGYKEEGITFPSTHMQRALLTEFYNECGISPACLSYFEAHGTGTYVGDMEELNALSNVVCENRKNPLLVGSVKSNLGHAEPAAGLCQIIKVIIAMETGIIPPNIHFKKARKDVEALRNGDIRIVTDPTPWKPGLVGINSFGFGGTNGHVLLRPNSKNKLNKGLPNDQLPRLIVMSGRTEHAVESFLNDIESQPMDVEYLRLLHDIFATDIPNHPYRGYAIIERETSVKPIKEIQRYSGMRQPICFVFSGIGSQWHGMGQALMQFPAFSETVEKCDKILRPYGVYIVEMLTGEQENICNTILNSLLGITVMQIGLIELLKLVNVVPDHVIGYSLGELCCGYITDTFTLEQVILSAYYIGLALNESNIISGAMMNIELDYEKLKGICVSDIAVSRLSPKICRISGPKETIKSVTTKFQNNNISITEINCNHIPLNSHYIVPTKAKIHAYLTKILPQTMASNHAWTNSTCDTEASYAEYFTNTLLNPVFFEKVTHSIPKHAIAIEIAPHGILQNVIKECFDTSIALMQCNQKDNVKVFLQSLGKIYNTGSQMELANLYPAIQLPVSRGTPMISPSLKWDHSKDYYVTSYMQQRISSSEELVTVSLTDEDFEFMSGHVIDGRNLIPETGYLCLVWKTIGKLKGILNPQVVFEEVKFLRTIQFQKERTVELTIMLQKVTGKFEVVKDGNAVVTGTIRIPVDVNKEKVPHFFLQQHNNKEEVMTAKDIYKELKLRGYQYSGSFRGITSASSMGEQGHIAWELNWVTFMDCMLQLKILGMDTNGLYVPTGIKKLVIDPKLHGQQLRTLETDDKRLPVYVYNDYDIVTSGSIEICGIKTDPITRRKARAVPVLERYEFVPHRDRNEISLHNAMFLSMHLIVEHCQLPTLNIIEMIESNDQVTSEDLASPIIIEIAHTLPLVQPNVNLIARTERFDNVDFPPSIVFSKSNKLSKDDNAVLIVGFDLLERAKSETLKEGLQALRTDGFLLTRGEALVTKEDRSTMEKHNLVVVLEKRTKQEYITLLRKKPKFYKRTEVVRINDSEFSWVENLKAILNAQNESRDVAKIILVEEKEPECGLLGFVKCLTREPDGDLIRAVIIQDENAPAFSLHEPLYAQQLERDLVINVLRPGKIWGSYRHLPLPSLALKPVHHAFINQQVRGDLTSLCWLQGEITPDNNQDIVRIIYASINFKDVMIATGKVNMDSFATRGRLEECFLGLEYVGFDNAGHRIMGLCENRCISNLHLIDRNLCWNIPDEWTLEDAATVPCAYATCYYALYLRAKMKKNHTILIHSGAGAVGQAAIHLASYAGCEIFTTVGTPDKRKFIRDTFPSIPENHIGSSHDTSFEQMVLRQTEGRGVDIVLNSLAEEKLQASVRCVARGGCFLEIGQFDFMADNLLDLSFLSKEITFFSILLHNVFIMEKKKRDVSIILSEGLKAGAIKPLCRRVFHKDEVENAFRHMASGRHIGKIILKIQEEDNYANIPFLARPRYYCSTGKTYVLLGGTGGFGLELTDWLIRRGARNVVLVSRSGLKNGYQHRKVKIWKSYGVNVLLMSNVDASIASDCDIILKAAEKLAPVDAIFNLALVLNDKIYRNHTVETFAEPFKAKAWATRCLDQASRKICPQLRKFVIFSSVSCGRGNAGQTNYGMTNSIMERICEKRSQEGLPGLAIEWGAIGDVGILVDMIDDDYKEMIIHGTLQQKINSCIEKLEEFLLQEYPVVSSMVIAEKLPRLSTASNVSEVVANVMDIKDLKLVGLHTPLSELGIDSMMTAEIKHRLERDFDTFLTLRDVRTLTFTKLIEMSGKDPQEEKCTNSIHDEASELAGIKLLAEVVDNEPFTNDVCVDLPIQQTNTKSEIFLIPGLVGCRSVFNPLMQKIAASATYLQHGTYMVGPNCTSINEIADCMLQHILRRNKVGEHFVMVGYSFGALIAIELTRRLEARNIRGCVILIDGAPDQLKTLANQHLHFTTIEELENNVLFAIMDNLKPTNSGKLFVELKKCNTWDEKLNTFISQLSLSEINDRFSIDMRKAFCTTIYKHRFAIHEYDGTEGSKIQSPIMLLKPVTQSIISAKEDYGLHKITDKNVDVQYMDGNHVTILNNQKVLDAINKMLLKI